MEHPITSKAPIPDTADQLRRAKFAPLDMTPVSPSAKALEDDLFAQFLSSEELWRPRTRQRNGSAAKALRVTVSAFTADLLRARSDEEAGGFCWHPKGSGYFADTLASKRQFDALISVWTWQGLLEHHNGFQIEEEFDEGQMRDGQRWASRYRARSSLLEMAKAHGITPENVGEHYEKNLSGRSPVELRARKRGKRKGTRGRRMRINRKDPKPVAFAQDVQELNVFLATQRFTNCETPNLVRIFNDGNQAGFDWNRGGRHVIRGSESVQSMKRELRADVKIDGSKTAEVDFGSSQLTLAYALAGETIPEGDLYDIQGVPRLVVKRVVVAYIGKGSAPTQWPDHLKAEFREQYDKDLTKQFVLKRVVSLIEQKHPVLKRLGGLGLEINYLQFVESEIISSAMLDLMRVSEVPSVPIHDCLLVKKKDVQKTKEAMSTAFCDQVGVKPTLSVKS
ncbi:hypothetical protein [Maritimibacter dapengensis]|uniref:Uncharacterized protein n=1 Tax=Maritimibacter dapengensis TaxID=2836868 RepID=A0ABS6T7G0_9RHOB|nr:hypothetical protein [Maritimibacter dapengensis]MBV7381170.1 hypothetical protein [Maritimibacter dapengensis]